jgi:phytoene synthase
VRAFEPVAVAAPLSEDGSTDLNRSYRICREITRSHSTTFYFASLFLSPERRKAIWAVYAFCRTADDIVDTSEQPAARLSEIDSWQSELLAAYSGRAQHPAMIAFADAVTKFDVPIEPALQLLRGARNDVTTRRYETYDELREYCYLVASTVGLMTSPILGYAPGALEYGVALGLAMQMTNIMRDVGEDAAMGRIYLPAEDFRRFGYSEDRLMDGVVDDSFVEMMRFEISRIRRIYDEATPGIELLVPESRYAVRLALRLYSQILDEIEHNGYDVFSRRAFVPLRSRLTTALMTALSR